MTTPSRILIIKPSALGDVVHGLPVLRLLRARFPDAQIDWLIARPFANLIEGHPDLNNLIELDRNPRAFLRLAWTLRSASYDWAIDLQGLARSAVLTFATRAAVRVGFAYARELAPLAYNQRVAAREVGRHAVERYLDVAEHLGCDRGPVEFVFASTPADLAFVNDRTQHLGPFAVIAPGTNWPSKRWPVEHFAKLSVSLKDKGFAIVIVGGNDAVEIAKSIPCDLNLAGSTTLKQLVELLGAASIVVANDSGPMHIASALGTPLVVPFGPTDANLTGPFGRPQSVIRASLPCSPCFSRDCSHISCLSRISPDNVLAVCGQQLNS